MSRLSAALLLASQLAEYEAVKSRQDHVQPEHLMIAVLSLDKVFDPAVQWQFQIADDTLAQVRSEWEPVRAILVMHGADPSRIRRTVRRSLEQQTLSSPSKVAIPEPSAETAQVLSRASRIADVMRSERLRVEHFLTAVLGEPIPRVQDLLRKLNLDVAALRLALIPLERPTRPPASQESAAPIAEESAAPAAEENATAAAQESVVPVAEVNFAAAAEERAVSVAEESAAPAAEKNVTAAAQESFVPVAEVNVAPVAEERAVSVAEESAAPAAEENAAPAGQESVAPAAVEGGKTTGEDVRHRHPEPPVTVWPIASPAPIEDKAPPVQPPPVPASMATAEPPQEQQEVAMIHTRVLESVDAGRPAAPSLKGAAQRLACLCEVPGQLEKQTRLEPFLHRFLRGAMEGLPDAPRGAILMRGSGDDDFLLKAHYPVGEPTVNLTAARQAIESRQAFISRSHTPEADAVYGLYAPMIFKGEILGVLCVDGAPRQTCFDADDLTLVMVFAQHAAMAIANYRLQDDARRNGALVERLLTNFSPKIRQRLLERARRGRLQLGGERSEVTIMFSDIRNFTSITADLETEDVMDMLNECFSASAESIFKFGGTIDKFVGDAILAVFGSPDPDPHQHINSLRAALSMQAAVAQLNRTRVARGRVPCQIGIGVHCGEVLHGFVGAAERIEFTVIGDAVNKASRYCSAAPAGDVLISSELYQRVWRKVEATQTTIPTKHEGPLSAYRIRGLRQESSPKMKSA